MKTIRLDFIVALLLVLAIFYSCDVYYTTPQPSWIKKNEKTIPAKFHGTYLSAPNGVLEAMAHNGKRDTILISEKRIYIDQEMDFHLSDSVLLRKYHHDYYLNIFESERKAWIVILVKEMQNKIYYYMIPSEESVQLDRLKTITKVNRLDSDGKEFIINPTRREFNKILKANLFTPQDTLTRLE